eukprot:scaffold802_cov280-Pinguiococcus_pyrenoidosus.AAC.4
MARKARHAMQELELQALRSVLEVHRVRDVLPRKIHLRHGERRPRLTVHLPAGASCFFVFSVLRVVEWTPGVPLLVPNVVEGDGGRQKEEERVADQRCDANANSALVGGQALLLERKVTSPFELSIAAGDAVVVVFGEELVLG